MSLCAPARFTGLRHRVADHAASGAMRDLLEHHRLSYASGPLSEGAVFGLSGALDLRVRMVAHGVPAIDLEGRAPSLEIDLCRHLAIGGELCTTDDPQAGWQMLQAELDAGEPTLVRADARELDYRGGGHHDTRHAIVVTAYDTDAGLAWVSDHGFPEPQRCSLDALARARASEWGAEPVRHAILRLRPRRRLAEPRAAITAALRRTTDSMRGRGALPPYPNVRSGLAGIDALADGWSQLPEMTGPRLGETLAAMRFRIRDGGGTGAALYRSLQARFLHEAAELLGAPQLSRAALVCDDLSDAWRAFAGATDDRDATHAHRAAQAPIQRVQALEHRHVEVLEAHLDGGAESDL